MKYVIAAVVAVLVVAGAVRILKKIKPEWGSKLASFVVGE